MDKKPTPEELILCNTIINIVVSSACQAAKIKNKGGPSDIFYLDELQRIVTSLAKVGCIGHKNPHYAPGVVEKVKEHVSKIILTHKNHVSARDYPSLVSKLASLYEFDDMLFHTRQDIIMTIITQCLFRVACHIADSQTLQTNFTNWFDRSVPIDKDSLVSFVYGNLIQAVNDYRNKNLFKNNFTQEVVTNTTLLEENKALGKKIQDLEAALKKASTDSREVVSYKEKLMRATHDLKELQSEYDQALARFDKERDSSVKLISELKEMLEKVKSATIVDDFDDVKEIDVFKEDTFDSSEAEEEVTWDMPRSWTGDQDDD